MSVRIFFIWILANTAIVTSIIVAGLTIDCTPPPVIGWSVIGVSIGLIQKMLLLPYLGEKYDQGLYRVNETWLYINRGLGLIMPVRLNCPPEITEITLVRA